LSKQATGGTKTASAERNIFLSSEKGVQQVLDIEKQAGAIQEAALSEAEQLPIEAGKEAQAILDKARADAQEKARQMVANAQAEDESARILSQAAKKAESTESLALSNFDRAVAYVLARVTGRE